jgi:hypothetical protein
MKKLIMIGAATAALFASPAFAQSYNPGFGTGNVIDEPALERAASTNANAAGSYAYEPARASTHHVHARARVETPNG